MKKGFLIIALSWIGGIAFGLFSLIVWGIMQIVQATANPPSGSLAWGIAWIFLSVIIAAAIIMIGSVIGGGIAINKISKD